MAVSSIHNGFHWDVANSRLDLYYRGTKLGYFTGALMTIAGATGLTVTNAITSTAGSITATAGNLVLGAPGAFATTQPVAAIKMGGSSSGGTAPSGAIATSGGLFASDTVVRKIIADGTASNVET